MEQEEILAAQEVVDLLTIILIEVVAALEPDTKIADEKLEDIASKLLATFQGLRHGPNKRLAALVQAVAQQLIQTEAGAA